MRVVLSGGLVAVSVRDAVRSSLAQAARTLEVGAGDVAVRFASRDEMAVLNAEWRGESKATDVLSFPMNAVAPDGRRHIGDIALCTDVAVEQAAARGHSVERESALLAIHGLLHLLGFDHETDDGEMDTLEARLRERVLGATR